MEEVRVNVATSYFSATAMMEVRIWILMTPPPAWFCNLKLCTQNQAHTVRFQPVAVSLFTNLFCVQYSRNLSLLLFMCLYGQRPILDVSTFVLFRGTDGDGPLILLVDKACTKISQLVSFMDFLISSSRHSRTEQTLEAVRIIRFWAATCTILLCMISLAGCWCQATILVARQKLFPVEQSKFTPGSLVQPTEG